MNNFIIIKFCICKIGIIIVEEDGHFFIDIETYAHNNRAEKDIYLLFQVFSEKNKYIPPGQDDEEEKQLTNLNSDDEDQIPKEPEEEENKNGEMTMLNTKGD